MGCSREVATHAANGDVRRRDVAACDTSLSLRSNIACLCSGRHEGRKAAARGVRMDAATVAGRRPVFRLPTAHIGILIVLRRAPGLEAIMPLYRRLSFQRLIGERAMAEGFWRMCATPRTTMSRSASV